MFLSEYLADLTKTIDEYAKTSIILFSKVESDFRTERIGFIKGKLYLLMIQNYFLQNTWICDTKLKNLHTHFIIKTKKQI